MNKRPGWKPASLSIFEPIVDMHALDASLQEFLARECHAPTTRVMYEYLWGRWEDFCNDRGFPPLGAPIEAVHALVGASARGTLRRKGKGRKLTGAQIPFSPSHLDCWLAAISDAHTKEGLVVAWAQDAHRHDFKLVRAGYRRWHGSAGGTEAVPLTAEAARRMLPLELPWTVEDCRRRAAVLTALDLAVPVELLAAITPSDISVTGPSSVVLQLPGQAAPEVADAQCQTRVLVCSADVSQPIPDPCLHCALVALLSWSPPASESLFRRHAETPQGAHRDLELLLGRAASSWQGLEYRDGVLTIDAKVPNVSPWLRHALARDQQASGLSHLRARAMVLLSWHVGLRSSDARWLLRSDIVIDGDRLTGFRRTSGQPTSLRSAGFALVPSVERQLCAFSALREWLCVRDLAAGAGNDAEPVFCHLGKVNGLKPGRPITHRCSCWFMWRDLQDQAGMERVYSPGSSRTGYTEIALAGGASTYAVQASLNQKKPDHVAQRARARRQREGSAPRALLDGFTRGEQR